MQVFDVGQGEGIFILFPNFKTMLVDLGSKKNKDLTGKAVFSYLEKQGFGGGKQLDYLIITHANVDHYNLVLEFLSKYKQNKFKFMFGGKQEHYQAGFINKLRELGEPIKPPSEPFSLIDDFGPKVGVRVLAINALSSLDAQGIQPEFASDHAWITNSASVVLRIDCGDAVLTMTGDATRDTERWVLMTENVSSDVLVVAHHGSYRTSNSPAWLTAVSPSFAFVSSDRQGTRDPNIPKPTGYGLPQQLVLQLLATSGFMENQCVTHGWVGSFLKSEYDQYNKDFPNAPLAYPQNDSPAWIQGQGTTGIFTTLSKMDASQTTQGEWADQGTQYEVVVDRSTSQITVNATEDDTSATSTTVAVRKKTKRNG
ncbi:MAG: ComEC/Rec2 family competence protein [Allosphingosinicella sp.]